MKLIDRSKYAYGTCIDIIKFKRRSLFEVSFEDTTYNQFPSLLIQFGPSDLFYMSLGLVKYIATFTIWGRHYDD